MVYNVSPRRFCKWGLFLRPGSNPHRIACTFADQSDLGTRPSDMARRLRLLQKVGLYLHDEDGGKMKRKKVPNKAQSLAPLQPPSNKDGPSPLIHGRWIAVFRDHAYENLTVDI